MTLNYPDIRSRLQQPQEILIVSHRNPDGDAIGSSLAVSYWLQSIGHVTKVVFPSEFPSTFSWLPQADKILSYDLDEEEVDSFINKATIVFALDFNALERIDKLGEQIRIKKPFIIHIDHHLYPENFADLIYSDTKASSTCEMVFKFIHDAQIGLPISIAATEAILMGIITDTGSYQHSTTSETLKTVAHLYELGADANKINWRLHQMMPEKNIRLLGHCLQNRMEILPDFRTGIIFLNKNDYAVFDIQRGDTEGIVNYLLKLKSVNLAIFVTQQPNIIKLSFRSKGTIPAEEIARKHFNGGGHRNAAGGYAHGSLSNVLSQLKSILPAYKEILNVTPYI